MKYSINPELIVFRYLESGSFRGFMPQALQHLKKFISLPDSDIYSWEVYTQHDIKLQQTKSSTKYSDIFLKYYYLLLYQPLVIPIKNFNLF